MNVATDKCQDLYSAVLHQGFPRLYPFKKA